VTVMVPAGQSPHSFEPKPKQLMAAHRADAYFKVGSGLEFELTHLETLKGQNPSMSVVDLSKGIGLKSLDEHYGHKGAENGEEEGPGGKDPHIWTSPPNLKVIYRNIAEGLSRLDGENRKDYEDNLEDQLDRLEEVHEKIKETLAPFRGRSFLTYHPSWGYFGDTYELKQIALEKGGKEPGPKTVADRISLAKRESIDVVLVSPRVDLARAKVIAGAIKGEVVQVDPLNPNYLETLLKLARILKEDLES